MMSLAAKSASGTRGRIVTKNSARRSITAAGPRQANTTAAAHQKLDVSNAKSAGPRLRSVRTTIPKLQSDHVIAKRHVKLSESSHDGDQHHHPVNESLEAKKKLQRCIGMVRSFVRFTGAKKLREESFADADQNAGFTPSIEATYKLDPDHKAVPSRVSAHVQRHVAHMLDNYTYDAESAPKYSRALAACVTDAMKQLDLPRYRFVVNVTIGGNSGQAFGLTSRCLWDDQRDNYATIPFRGKDYFIVITVHSVYLD